MQHHKMIHTLAIMAMSAMAATFACAQTVAQSGNALKVGHLAHLTTVEIMINGTGPHTFVLDTGASVTVVNQSLVKSLNLPILGETEVGSPMGTVPIVVDSLAIADVGLGEVHVKNLSAISMDLDAMFGGLGAPAGILSAAGLDGFLVTIDLPNDQVLVRPGELPVADGRRILDYDKDHIVPRLPVTVAGEVVMVDLDTGAPFNIGGRTNVSGGPVSTWRFEGNVSQVVAFNQQLTGADLANVQQALSDKWGLSVAFGGDAVAVQGATSGNGKTGDENSGFAASHTGTGEFEIIAVRRGDEVATFKGGANNDFAIRRCAD